MTARSSSPYPFDSTPRLIASASAPLLPSAGPSFPGARRSSAQNVRACSVRRRLENVRQTAQRHQDAATRERVLAEYVRTHGGIQERMELLVKELNAEVSDMVKATGVGDSGTPENGTQFPFPEGGVTRRGPHGSGKTAWAALHPEATADLIKVRKVGREEANQVNRLRCELQVQAAVHRNSSEETQALLIDHSRLLGEVHFLETMLESHKNENRRSEQKAEEYVSILRKDDGIVVAAQREEIRMNEEVAVLCSEVRSLNNGFARERTNFTAEFRQKDAEMRSKQQEFLAEARVREAESTAQKRVLQEELGERNADISLQRRALAEGLRQRDAQILHLTNLQQKDLRDQRNRDDQKNEEFSKQLSTLQCTQDSLQKSLENARSEASHAIQQVFETEAKLEAQAVETANRLQQLEADAVRAYADNHRQIAENAILTAALESERRAESEVVSEMATEVASATSRAQVMEVDIESALQAAHKTNCLQMEDEIQRQMSETDIALEALEVAQCGAEEIETKLASQTQETESACQLLEVEREQNERQLRRAEQQEHRATCLDEKVNQSRCLAAELTEEIFQQRLCVEEADAAKKSASSQIVEETVWAAGEHSLSRAESILRDARNLVEIESAACRNAFLEQSSEKDERADVPRNTFVDRGNFQTSPDAAETKAQVSSQHCLILRDLIEEEEKLEVQRVHVAEKKELEQRLKHATLSVAVLKDEVAESKAENEEARKRYEFMVAERSRSLLHFEASEEMLAQRTKECQALVQKQIRDQRMAFQTEISLRWEELEVGLKHVEHRQKCALEEIATNRRSREIENTAEMFSNIFWTSLIAEIQEVGVLKKTLSEESLQHIAAETFENNLQESFRAEIRQAGEMKKTLAEECAQQAHLLSETQRGEIASTTEYRDKAAWLEKSLNDEKANLVTAETFAKNLEAWFRAETQEAGELQKAPSEECDQQAHLRTEIQRGEMACNTESHDRMTWLETSLNQERAKLVAAETLSKNSGVSLLAELREAGEIQRAVSEECVQQARLLAETRNGEMAHKSEYHDRMALLEQSLNNEKAKLVATELVSKMTTQALSQNLEASFHSELREVGELRNVLSEECTRQAHHLEEAKKGETACLTEKSDKMEWLEVSLTKEKAKLVAAETSSQNVEESFLAEIREAGELQNTLSEEYSLQAHLLIETREGEMACVTENKAREVFLEKSLHDEREKQAAVEIVSNNLETSFREAVDLQKVLAEEFAQQAHLLIETRKAEMAFTTEYRDRIAVLENSLNDEKAKFVAADFLWNKLDESFRTKIRKAGELQQVLSDQCAQQAHLLAETQREVICCTEYRDREAWFETILNDEREKLASAAIVSKNLEATFRAEIREAGELQIALSEKCAQHVHFRADTLREEKACSVKWQNRNAWFEASLYNERAKLVAADAFSKNLEASFNAEVREAGELQKECAQLAHLQTETQNEEIACNTECHEKPARFESFLKTEKAQLAHQRSQTQMGKLADTGEDRNKPGSLETSLNNQSAKLPSLARNCYLDSIFRNAKQAVEKKLDSERREACLDVKNSKCATAEEIQIHTTAEERKDALPIGKMSKRTMAEEIQVHMPAEEANERKDARVDGKVPKRVTAEEIQVHGLIQIPVPLEPSWTGNTICYSGSAASLDCSRVPIASHQNVELPVRSGEVSIPKACPRSKPPRPTPASACKARERRTDSGDNSELPKTPACPCSFAVGVGNEIFKAALQADVGDTESVSTPTARPDPGTLEDASGQLDDSFGRGLEASWSTNVQINDVPDDVLAAVATRQINGAVLRAVSEAAYGLQSSVACAPVLNGTTSSCSASAFRIAPQRGSTMDMSSGNSESIGLLPDCGIFLPSESDCANDAKLTPASSLGGTVAISEVSSGRSGAATSAVRNLTAFVRQVNRSSASNPDERSPGRWAATTHPCSANGLPY